MMLMTRSNWEIVAKAYDALKLKEDTENLKNNYYFVISVQRLYIHSTG
jgi:hypothetical protein